MEVSSDAGVHSSWFIVHSLFKTPMAINHVRLTKMDTIEKKC